MRNHNQAALCTVCTAFLLALIASVPLRAQAALPLAHRQAQTSPAQPPSEQDVAATQEQLLKLLRLSPVLTSVVARDPSLLSDQEYVARNNPELAQFILSHPDIAKNPEFYLFSRLENSRGHRDQALERAVWPDLTPPPNQRSGTEAVMDKIIPIIIVPGFFLAIVWIIRIFVESRRWSRAVRLQTEIHSRLIDKFETSQELSAYLESEAGQRFLMASPMAPGSGPGQRMPNAVARVMTPMQIGVVMTLLGIGFLFLRHADPEMRMPMTVLGTLVLMPGIGFILSAGATWALAHRLGLMPEKDEPATATFHGPQDRQ